MIDHTGHPHPSTPKARALCRANGGTGFIGKIGGNAPVADKKDHGKKPHVPQGPVNVTPKKPEPPKGPPVHKGPTVPKDHGNPKPPTPPRKRAPKAPPKEPPVARPVPGGNPRSVTPKNVDKNAHQILGEDGGWRNIGSITKTTGGRGSGGRHRAAGEYVFKDENGNVIKKATPSVKLQIRDKPGGPTPPAPPKPFKPPVGMDSFIPVANSGNKEVDAIQNALRRGASRDFILARTKMPHSTANREIDRILKQYGVPNHVYPRMGTGGPAPDIKDVKPVSPKVVDNKVEAIGSVDTPIITAFAHDYINLVNDANPEMKQTVNRVMTVQAHHVGKKITRIKGVDSKLPKVGTPEGNAWNIGGGTLAVCEHNGKIHLHENMHTKEGIVNNAMTSGWFTRGGVGNEQTLAHEMGHAFINIHKMGLDHRKRLAEAVIKEFGLESPWGHSPGLNWYPDMLNRLVQHPPNKAKLRRMVSKYGTTNMSELTAEIWSEYTMNPKPRPKLKNVGDVLKQIISEGVG